VAAVKVTVKFEPADKYAALSISTLLDADEELSSNTSDPLAGT